MAMAAWLMIGMNCAHAESSTGALVSRTSISDAIKKIGLENSTAKRREYAYQLTHMIAKLPSDAIDDQIISELGTLLEDRDDLVTGWIGPRAKQTIPALENALKRIECIYGSLTSEPAIRLALAKMDKNPHSVNARSPNESNLRQCH
jgi:hypothetical protein